MAKVDTDKNLYTQTIPVNRKVLVVGAGIAGIQTALDVADAGFPVTLVERDPSIGGKMVKLDKTFPAMDCSACICTPKMSEAGTTPTSPSKRFLRLKRLRAILAISRPPSAKGPSISTTTYALAAAPVKPIAQAVPSKPTIDPNSCRKLIEGKCGVCAKICPTGAIRYDDTDRTTTETFGAIMLAT